MEHKSLSDKIKFLFAAAVNGTSVTGNAPVLSNLFNSNWDLAQFFNAFFKTAIVVGAMLAVIRLGYAGFIYMTTDSFGTKGNAKTIIQEAVLGLMLLLSIWLILNQINPNLLNLNILQNVQSNQPAAQQTAPTPFAPGTVPGSNNNGSSGGGGGGGGGGGY